MDFEEAQGITVFEVPIYARSPEEHKKKWVVKKRRDYHSFMKCGASKKSAEDWADNIFRENSFWRYNQLVGMLSLSVKPDDPMCNEAILCNLYCNTVRPRYITSRSFLPFKNQGLFYEMIYISEISDDRELVSAIKEKIDFLKDQHHLQDYYFDCTALENMISLNKIKALFIEG